MMKRDNEGGSMYLNNLIDKEDLLTDLEDIKTMKYPDDYVEIGSDGKERKKRTGPVVKYGDVVKKIEGAQPAIYKMNTGEVEELNRAAGAYRPEDRRHPYVPEEERKPEKPEDNMEELVPGVSVGTIKDCSITVNIGKEK